MQFYSLNKKAPIVSFREAVIQGLAPDKGLYYPTEVPRLPEKFFTDITSLSDLDIACEAMHAFVSPDLQKAELRSLLEDVLDFPIPLVRLNENIASLELFHGPTMAFKDVGARFMARCLGHFFRGSHREITVLVATSGDTGGAVANGFLGVPGVRVVILYPSGKVSDIQERQLTTLGQNITALEVKDNFDACQALVKRAFLDNDIRQNRQLTSANSINVARWLPQHIYYLLAFKQLQPLNKELVISVPSGNFGNICAGMMAHTMGMPCSQFVASTNVNDTVPLFMRSGDYIPKASKQTISNAMDVGDPSNFIRIRHLFSNDLDALRQKLTSYSFSDTETLEAMKKVYKETGYITDPHGAVGYLGLTQYMKQHPGLTGIFLETAHPAKFRDTVESALGISLDLPPQLSSVLGKEKNSVSISGYEDLKDYLVST